MILYNYMLRKKSYQIIILLFLIFSHRTTLFMIWMLSPYHSYHFIVHHFLSLILILFILFVQYIIIERYYY